MTEMTLREMSDTDFARWQDYSIAEYAKDKRKSMGISAEAALKLSRDSFASLLPEGRTTPAHHLFLVVREGQTLGWVWFKITTQWGVTSAFIYDLEIKQAYRRQGVASMVMHLLEDEVRKHKATKIALHVFGQNTAARDLYLKAGYRITDYSMAKELGREPT